MACNEGIMVRRAITIVRDEGFSTYIKKLVLFFKNSFLVRRQRIFCMDNPRAITTVDSKMDIQITKVTQDNISRVTDFRTVDQVKKFRQLMMDGQYGVYAWIEGKVVGHGWAKVCEQSCCVVNGYFDLCPGEGLIHYCNVSEANRGQNIYPLMLTILCRQLFDKGNTKRIIIDTEVNNHASLRGIAKVGFTPLGNGVYVQVLGRRIFKHISVYGK